MFYFCYCKYSSSLLVLKLGPELTDVFIKQSAIFIFFFLDLVLFSYLRMKVIHQPSQVCTMAGE